MMNLHIANKNYSSWSLRPWVLMKTLGLPFGKSNNLPWRTKYRTISAMTKETA
jgi:glutathione S-transferase